MYTKNFPQTVRFTCATDDFQKSLKTVIFENCVKNLSFEKNQMFDVFTMARPVCIRLYFDLIKHFTPKPYVQKRCFLHF